MFSWPWGMGRRGRAALLAYSFLALALAGPCLAAGEAEVLVILWFDTEDYLLPADDDATKRLAEVLSARGIRGTFKLVGEKARVLERRGRSDVIAALKKHDIGYHSNFHSVHPTPTEYLADCGWADGVAEFVRREGGGAADVRRILGVETLSCYGQPGSSWGPQTLAGLPLIGVAPRGVPCYVDEGTHVGLEGKPFWYCGALNVYHMRQNYTRMELHGEKGLEEGCRSFQKIHSRLLGEGGGLISIFYHPCEWVHLKFWDGVNFSRGANPPREEWKPPPQRPAEETEAAFRRFEGYLDFQLSLGVKFVTASELPALYPDRVRSEGADLETALSIAGSLVKAEKVDVFADARGRSFSPADQLVLLAEVLGEAIGKGKLPKQAQVAGVLGPSEPPPATEVEELDWPAFRDALLDVRDELVRRRQVPSRVFAGTSKIAPADFLLACARALTTAHDSSRAGRDTFPAKVPVPRGAALATERWIAEDTPGLFGGWVIHREGFRAPRVMQAARLQAWTLKPARREAPEN